MMALPKLMHWLGSGSPSLKEPTLLKEVSPVWIAIAPEH